MFRGKKFLGLVALNYYYLDEATSILLTEFNDYSYEAIPFFIIDSMFFQLPTSSFFMVGKIEDIFAYFVYICLLMA